MRIIGLIIFISFYFNTTAQNLVNNNPFEKIFDNGSILYSPELLAKNRVQKLYIEIVAEKSDTLPISMIEFNNKGFPISEQGDSSMEDKFLENYYYDSQDRLSMIINCYETPIDKYITETSFSYDNKNRLLKQILTDFNYKRKVRKNNLEFGYESRIYDIHYNDSTKNVTVEFNNVWSDEEFTFKNKSKPNYFKGPIDSLNNPYIINIFDSNAKIIEIKHLAYFTDVIIRDKDGCNSSDFWTEKLYYDNSNKLVRSDIINCKNNVISCNYIYYSNGLIKIIGPNSRGYFHIFKYNYFK